jgi:hypothetical protein
MGKTTDERIDKKFRKLKKEFRQKSSYAFQPFGQAVVNELLLLEIAKLAIAVEDLEIRSNALERT